MNNKKPSCRPVVFVILTEVKNLYFNNTDVSPEFVGINMTEI